MLGLELVVLLGVAILVANGLARRLRVAPPILLLVCGALLGFIPALRGVSLPPDVVLLLFLPVLLFWESLTTSLREIRKNLRGIILTGTLLVVATAAAVAVVAHAFGMPWAPAWVLGAAVAPTDATAVGAFTRSLPRRNVTILRAESLINDGTALTIYGLAVAVTTGVDHATPLRITWLIVLAYGGGALVGLAAAWLVRQIRDRMDDPRQETIITIVTPFVAYLGAELIGASGVVAVVLCGLILSQAQPREARASTRRQSDAFWTISTLVMNAILFVVVGLELQATVRTLPPAAAHHRSHRDRGDLRCPGGRPYRLPLHLHGHDPSSRPAPSTAPAPGRQCVPIRQRSLRLPRRRVSGGSPGSADDGVVR